MDPKLLYESPFTDFDSNGVEGVFSPADAATLIQNRVRWSRTLRNAPAKPSNELGANN
jgi:hypothetical protein